MTPVSTSESDYSIYPHLSFDEEDYLQVHKPVYREVSACLKKIGSGKVLEIGCASGIAYTVIPESKNFELHGIDIVPEYIALAQKHGIHAVLSDVNTSPLPYEENTFDLVICNGILEHSLKPRHLIEESVRVLKPGGHILFSFPNATSARQRWNGFRGRTPFNPLIDNLLHHDFLMRCSVLYSIDDFSMALPKQLSIVKNTFLNLNNDHQHKGLISKLIRLVQQWKPPLRDIVMVEVQKNAS